MTTYSGPRVSFISGPAALAAPPIYRPASSQQPVLLGFGAADSFAAVAVRDTQMWSSNAKGVSNKAGVLKRGTNVVVVDLNVPLSKLSNGNWVDVNDLKNSPNVVPSDFVVQLQAALSELASLGYNTNPGESNGVVGRGTLNAMANAIGIVAGDIKGGEIAALAMTTALKVALTSNTISSETTTKVRQLAPALTVAIYAYIQKKRAAMADGGYNSDTGVGTTWTPTTIALVGLGGITIIGGLYLLLKK